MLWDLVIFVVGILWGVGLRQTILETGRHPHIWKCTIPGCKFEVSSNRQSLVAWMREEHLKRDPHVVTHY